MIGKIITPTNIYIRLEPGQTSLTTTGANPTEAQEGGKMGIDNPTIRCSNSYHYVQVLLLDLRALGSCAPNTMTPSWFLSNLYQISPDHRLKLEDPLLEPMNPRHNHTGICQGPVRRVVDIFQVFRDRDISVAITVDLVKQIGTACSVDNGCMGTLTCDETGRQY